MFLSGIKPTLLPPLLYEYSISSPSPHLANNATSLGKKPVSTVLFDNMAVTRYWPSPSFCPLSTGNVNFSDTTLVKVSTFNPLSSPSPITTLVNVTGFLVAMLSANKL